MKLRNKKTGEIIDVFPHKHSLLTQFNSLAELNEEWEDVEEPKEYWYISQYGDVRDMNLESVEKAGNLDVLEQYKEIGNYFATREEAEKAVEKLRAWKRLKDKGLKIASDIEFHKQGFNFWDAQLTFFFQDISVTIDDVKTDLQKLIFGGGE